ncbi:DNA (cytosine-5-)-methyltransferase (plasmid) [Rhodovastum atsumiense]|uniref:DNA (cytosine-5-)-methyltransferase n=1 Tax=Rhodovastum atsumiense TaxID=504468 RepID=A0A5M6IV47_9PROT|nr:DNA cytosine methyltransferase [Rhodovastum atsumiense]KAA5611819.1 DNA cytosine methyltransferase [Rhodovastum atsumiense]CAH2606071.1 DNA (cytosine-5-)-methyltransferase [Rhodovastum atsumiense]
MDALTKPEIDTAAQAKLARLARGEKPRVLDMFSGAGGISLGFQRAGFQIDGALELDELAACTHATNFHGGDPEQLKLHAKPRDMTKVEPEELVEELGLGSVDSAIDVLVGGPPCQAYARVGRAKLREVAEHPQAFKVDPRGNLFLRYLAYVKALRPLAILMENVPDILNFGGHNIIEEMVEALDVLGYDARYSLINSAFHGCPQMRDRVFLVAYRKELKVKPRFPKATHHMELPPGYAGTRAVALRYVDILGGAGYVQADLGDESLPFPVTAEEAIGDLPPILGTSVKRGARRFSRATWVPYREDVEPSDYASKMRNWKGFETDGGVIDHAIRYLPRDHLVFKEMRQGAEYPEAHATAVRIARREAVRLGIREGTKAYQEHYKGIVPPYDVSKFPNRWWKLRPDYPVRTLMAHLGKDTYSHIHWDGGQARTISVREAARLQGFPDAFRFCGTMNPAFRQIGNAVPPLMAAAIAKIMRSSLESAAKRLAGS